MARHDRRQSEASTGGRHPHKQNGRRELNGLQADARVQQIDSSPVNRLARHIPSDFDDLKVASFAETFFDD